MLASLLVVGSGKLLCMFRYRNGSLFPSFFLRAWRTPAMRLLVVLLALLLALTNVPHTLQFANMIIRAAAPNSLCRTIASRSCCRALSAVSSASSPSASSSSSPEGTCEGLDSSSEMVLAEPSTLSVKTTSQLEPALTLLPLSHPPVSSPPRPSQHCPRARVVSEAPVPADAIFSRLLVPVHRPSRSRRRIYRRRRRLLLLIQLLLPSDRLHRFRRHRRQPARRQSPADNDPAPPPVSRRSSSRAARRRD